MRDLRLIRVVHSTHGTSTFLRGCKQFYSHTRIRFFSQSRNPPLADEVLPLTPIPNPVDVTPVSMLPNAPLANYANSRDVDVLNPEATSLRRIICPETSSQTCRGAIDRNDWVTVILELNCFDIKAALEFLDVYNRNKLELIKRNTDGSVNIEISYAIDTILCGYLPNKNQYFRLTDEHQKSAADFLAKKIGRKAFKREGFDPLLHLSILFFACSHAEIFNIFHVVYVLATARGESFLGWNMAEAKAISVNTYEEPFDIYEPVFKKGPNNELIGPVTADDIAESFPGMTAEELRRLRVRANSAKTLGNIHQGDGERFKGRGYTMLTGRGRYKKVSDENIVPGLNFEENPEKAAEPLNSAAIIAVGMKQGSIFTRYKLEEVTSTTNIETFFMKSRRIINKIDTGNPVHENKQIEIATYAQQYLTSLKKD